MKILKYLLLGLTVAFVFTACAVTADYDAKPISNVGFDYEGW